MYVLLFSAAITLLGGLRMQLMLFRQCVFRSIWSILKSFTLYKTFGFKHHTLLSLEWWTWGVRITLHKNNSQFLKTRHTVRCPVRFNREQTSDSSLRVQTTKFLPLPGDRWEIIMKHSNSDIVLLHCLQIKGIKLLCHKYNTWELCSLFSSHNRWLLRLAEFRFQTWLIRSPSQQIVVWHVELCFHRAGVRKNLPPKYPRWTPKVLVRYGSWCHEAFVTRGPCRRPVQLSTLECLPKSLPGCANYAKISPPFGLQAPKFEAYSFHQLSCCYNAAQFGTIYRSIFLSIYLS